MRPMFSKSLATLIFVVSATLASSALAAAPTITSFTPGGGKLSTAVTITGTGFVSPVTVTFAGVASTSATVTSSTSLTALVPLTAGTGTITVKDAGGTVTSATAFNVFPGDITSFANTNPGTAGVIYFSGFNAFEAVDFYFDTTDFAVGSSSNAGAGNAAATIPATATPGTHWITAVGRHSGYSAQFSYLVRTDWVGFSFRANHRGRNPFESVLSTDTVANLEELWRIPGVGSVNCTCADVGGIVYGGFGDSTVRAFNETTGAQKWTYRTGDLILGSPAVVNGTVYVGSDDFYLYALDANTGALKWRYLVGDVIRSSPAVKGGIVYFGSFDDNVYALNATTGTLVWKFKTGAAIFSSPAVGGGTVFIGSNDANVYALDAGTGAEIWSRATGAGVAASPIVVGGVVYIGSDDETMYALRTTNGATLWSYKTGGAIQATAAMAGGVVYLDSDDANIYALNAATGSLRWSTVNPTGSACDQAVCYANGVVYAGDSQHTFVLDASYGGILTTLPAGTSFGGATVVNGSVTIADYYGNGIAHFTLNASINDATSAAPDPAKLRHHPLR
jgi:outer membrane protein assembly factor BamB